MKKKLQNLSIRVKSMILIAALLFISIVGISYFSYNKFRKSYVLETAGGQMNFVDAKQQGTIRLLDQNIKLAKQLSGLYKDLPKAKFQKFITDIVNTDVFNLADHPFKDEITAKKRKIQTWKVYHSIDILDGDRIVMSTDPARVGKRDKVHITEVGYSNVYGIEGKYNLSFAHKIKDNLTVQVIVDAYVLTIITNGEIGNMAGKMGAFYLAGVGKSMDYYIVDENNKMITGSRVFPDAMLKQSGSKLPWQKTQKGHKESKCKKNGTYLTNAGATTGCREAMGFYMGADGKLKLGSSMPYYDSQWTIVVEQDAEEVLSPLYKVKNLIIFATCSLLIVGVFLSISFSNSLVKPIHETVFMLKDIAEGKGDLTKRLKVDADAQNEIGHLAKWFNQFTGTIQMIITKIAANSQHTSATAEQLSATFEEISSSSHNIKISINQVVENANSLNEYVNVANKETGSLVESIKTISDLSDRLFKVANEANSAASSGVVAAKSAGTKLENIRTTFGTSEEMIKNLEGKTNQINQVIEVINSISDRTSLISLNASIEAARAGESGKGFAVVADEVGKLADESQVAIKEIENIVKEIIEEMGKSVNAMDHGREEINDGSKVINEALNFLNLIFQKISLVSERTLEIQDTTNEQIKSSATVEESVRMVHEVTEANVNSTEQIKLGINETATAIEEVTESAQNISHKADELNELVMKFKV